MKRVLFIIIIFTLAFGAFAESYPPEGWVTDIFEAIDTAQEQDKRILLNFTGSDWCIWCERLRDEVFSTEAFQNYAEDNLVLLFLDFPNGISLSADQEEHNQKLASLFGVSGYPTIWIMDNDLTPILQTGYVRGGGQKYVEHLKTDTMGITAEQNESNRQIVAQFLEEYF